MAFLYLFNNFVFFFSDLPEHPRSVFTARNEVVTCLVEIELPNGRLMSSLHRIGAEPIFHGLVVVPAPDTVVIGTRVQAIATRVPFHELDVLGVAAQDPHTRELAIFLLVSFPDPNGLITTACSE